MNEISHDLVGANAEGQPSDPHVADEFKGIVVVPVAH